MLYKQIRYFLEVASCLSFTVAAKNLYMSQQAVTKQIAALEEELGFRLFYRSTRKVTLTPAGARLRDDFVDINRQIGASIRRARELAGSESGLVRVGFWSSLSRRDIILPVTGYLYRAFPETRFELKLLDFVQLRNQLLDHKLDICVTTSNDWQLWPSAHGVVLVKKQFQAVFSQSHPLAALEHIRLEDLAKHTQLTLPQDNLLAGVEQWAKGVPFKKAVLCPDISSLLVRLELAEGFALLTKVFEGHEGSRLRYWPIPFPQAHAEIVCICREDEDSGISAIVRGIQGSGAITLADDLPDFD